MWGNRMPILISDGCDDITATRNADKTYRVTAKVKVKQADGQETEATIEVERASLHIEALESGGEFYKLIVPVEESLSVVFQSLQKTTGKCLDLATQKQRSLPMRLVVDELPDGCGACLFWRGVMCQLLHKETDIQRYMVRHKYLNEEELEYQANAINGW